MKKIFISYRRDDSIAVTGRLAGELRARYGGEAVFHDIQQDSIQTGLDFGTAIQRALPQAQVMLVVAGAAWAGNPRLHDPADWVRLEVEAGLGRGESFPVILLRAEDARIDFEALPDALKPLAKRDNQPLRSGTEWDFDLGELLKALGGFGLTPGVKDSPGPSEADGGGYSVNVGKVDTGGGDFVGRDKNVTAGPGGIAVGGNVSGSTFITGSGNQVSYQAIQYRQQKFGELLAQIETAPGLPPEDRQDASVAVKELRAEAAKAEPDEGFLATRLRNLKRMSKDIYEIALLTLLDPLAGFGVVVTKVAGKMKGVWPGAA